MLSIWSSQSPRWQNLISIQLWPSARVASKFVWAMGDGVWQSTGASLKVSGRWDLDLGYWSTHFPASASHSHQPTWGRLAFCACLYHSGHQGKVVCFPHTSWGVWTLGSWRRSTCLDTTHDMSWAPEPCCFPSPPRGRWHQALLCLRFPASSRSQASDQRMQAGGFLGNNPSSTALTSPGPHTSSNLDSLIGKTNPEWLKLISNFALYFELNFWRSQKPNFSLFFSLLFDVPWVSGLNRERIMKQQVLWSKKWRVITN